MKLLHQYPTTAAVRLFSTTGAVTDPVQEDGSQKEVDSTITEDKSNLVPGKPYRNIDTSVKHLQHMTSEDLAAPDQMMVASEMKDLILEAKDKIKPVVQAMPEAELREIIMTLEEAK